MGEREGDLTPSINRFEEAVRQVMRGAAMKVVQELLGHTTIEMTMR